MRGSIRDRALSRFEGIRSDALTRLAVARPAIDTSVPDGRCVSCIVRLEVNAQLLMTTIGDLQRRIAATGPVYCYPPASVHLSILGLTQRMTTADLDGDHLADLVGLVRRECSGRGAIDVELGRLNLLGTQWFVEGLTDAPTISTLRSRLAAGASALGHSPITFADTEPLHVNVARMMGPPDATACRRLLEDDSVVGRMLVLEVDVVVTDFLVTAEGTRPLAGVSLIA